jgi:hypothetical protein
VQNKTFGQPKSLRQMSYGRYFTARKLGFRHEAKPRFEEVLNCQFWWSPENDINICILFYAGSSRLQSTTFSFDDVAGQLELHRAVPQHTISNNVEEIVR